MKSRLERWLEALERRGLVKRREEVLGGLIVLGSILAAAGIVFLVLVWRR